jgi:hypothetical protein
MHKNTHTGFGVYAKTYYPKRRSLVSRLRAAWRAAVA